MKVMLITFFSGIVIHFFGLVNVLHNYDDIYVWPTGYGTGLHSGRWVLTVLGDFIEKAGGNYNLSYVNGVIFILLLSITTGVLLETLQIKSWKSGVVIGLLIVSFPSVISTMFFRYTVIYYGIAILLAVLAVWFLEKIKFGIIISMICISISLGIYQAYLPLTISLMILVLLKQVLEQDVDIVSFFRKGVYYCISLIGGLVFYYITLKLCLNIYGISLGDYQGVSAMGQIKLSDIPGLIAEAITSFYKLPIVDYCNLAPNHILKSGYFLLAILCIAGVVTIIYNKKKKIENILMVLFLGLVFPLAVNFIVVMCPDSWIYTIMVFSFVVVLFVPCVVEEALEKNNIQNVVQNIVKRGSIAILIIMICCYSYIANVNYTTMYYTDRQTENYMNAMITQIRMTENFSTDKKWVVIGERVEDPLFYNAWSNLLLYGGNGVDYINEYSRWAWVQSYFGYEIPWAESSISNEIQKSEEVKKMPCWPNEGSVKVIGENVVIKLQNIE